MRCKKIRTTAHIKSKQFLEHAGFTLVEIIVSLGLFSVVSTIAIGSLILLMDNNQQLRSDQSVISNVGFAFDMMSRDIRTGVDYYCNSNNFHNQDTYRRNTQDCSEGRDVNGVHGVSFIEPTSILDGDFIRIAYYYDESEEMIYRRIHDNDQQSIISSQLKVLDADFIVTGSDPEVQPSVTIFLEVESDDGQVYKLQTTVTQRLLDIQS